MLALALLPCPGPVAAPRSTDPVTPGGLGVVERLPWHDDGVWLAGDPHTHNLVGDETDPGALETAVASGIDFVALMDHAHRFFFDDPAPYAAELRERHPELLLLAGVEWNFPAGDHAAVLVARHPEEWKMLARFTLYFDRKVTDPASNTGTDDDPKTWGSVQDAVRGLHWLADREKGGGPASAVYLSHLSRHGYLSVKQIERLRDAGLAGIEAAPGHQRKPDRSPTIDRHDPFVAKVGGGYDRVLRSGHLGLASGSDFHKTSSAYYPGEFSRTLVYAPDRSSAGVIAGLSRGATATVHGGIVDRVETRTVVAGETDAALIGETLRVPRGAEVVFTVLATVPAIDSLGGDNRIDEVEVISDWSGKAKTVRVFATADETGTMRLEYRLPTAATARRGSFILRARGRRKIGDLGGDAANADYLFYTSATRIEVVR
jgi:hypothetical protein